MFVLLIILSIILIQPKKVDDYFIEQKNNIIEIKNKVQDSIKYRINEKEIDKIVNSQKKLVEDFFMRRAEESENIHKKIQKFAKFRNRNKKRNG